MRQKKIYEKETKLNKTMMVGDRSLTANWHTCSWETLDGTEEEGGGEED